MTNNTTIQNDVATLIASEQIRQIVELHPEVMPILSGYGLDLCCGGAHTIAEAAQLHGLDPELISEQVSAAITVRARG